MSAKHSIQAGVNVQVPKYDLDLIYDNQFYQYVDSSDTFQDGNRNSDTSSASVTTVKLQTFIQHKFRVTEGLSFVTGAHLQYLAYSKAFNVEPRFALKYKYGKGHAFSLGFGMHTRFESLGYYGSQVKFYTPGIPEPVIKTPNRYLKPSRAIHAVIGKEFRIAKHLSLQIEGYFQHLYHVPVDTYETSYHSSLNYEYSFYYGQNVSEGLGRNYGIDVTLEKSLSKNYYALINGSWYQSKYRAYDGVWRNTRYNGNFIFSGVLGKDFVIGKEKNNRFSLNAKILWTGNNREEFYYDPETKEFKPFEVRYANYFRMDTRVAYIRNKSNYSWTLSLDIQNVTNRLNETANERINSQGLIPFLFYKVEF